MLEYIKDVKVNSKEIQLTLGKQLTGLRQDVTLVISLKDNQIAGIEVKNFASEKLSMYLKATIDFNEPTFRTIDQSKYLDLDALYSGIENLLNSKDTGLVGYVDLGIKDKFSGRLNIELAKKLRETGLMGYMNIGLTSGKNNLSLQTNFFDNTLFASFQGLNIKIGANDISGAVKNICEAFNIDYEKCSGIVTSIEALLGGKGLISALSGYTFNTKLPKVDTSNLKFDLAQIVDILSGITINSKQINMTLDGALLGLEGTITLVIDLNDNNMITRAYLSGLNYKEYSLGCDLHLDYSEQTIPTFEVEEREKYIDLYGLSEAIKPVYDTIKEGSISGEFTLEFEYKGETNPLQVKYGVKLDKSGLTGFIQTEFKGLNINIYYIDKTLYFDIVGLKVYLNTTDFDEFKERLGIKDDGKTDETIENFKALVNAKTINEFIDALAKIDLGFVESAVFTSGNIDAKFRGNVQIGVTYGEKVERLTLNAKGVKVELACTSFDEVTIDTLDTTKFEPYTILFDTYDNIKTTLAQKQFSAHVSASSYVEKAVKDQASVNLNLDITNGINANGDITVSGNTNMYLTFGYQDDTLFAKYGNMKLKIQRSGLASLLAIALDLVGIDPGTVLGDDYSDVNINSDAIKEIIPDFDMGNPLNLLYLIKSIDIEDGAFIIVLNGSRINTKSGKDMTLKFKTDKTGVTEVDLLNIYTSADSNEYFNFVLTFGEFAGVEAIEDNGYIDITSSPDLIQGLINTYDLKEWNIKGTVALAIFNFEGLINVDVEAQIKIVDKKPVIAIEITNFPLVNVFGYGTDANTNGTGLSRKRTISIYYKDGYCYLKTYDPKVDALLSANRHAELVRETKVPYTEVFNNIEHYLQWLFGFSSAIMTKIHDAIEVSKSQPIDVSNLLNDYSFDGKTHTIAVNMEAITHDPNVGTLSVSFETVDKSSQGERAKHYVSKLGIDLSLVGILDVKTTKDSPLNVQFDTPTDFTAMEKYISEFNSTKTPYKDYWTEGGDKSLKNGDNKYNVVLNKDNGEAEQNITGVVGDLVTTNTYEDSREKIVLADLETKIVDDGITVKYYDFEGWYYENGEKFVEEYLTNNLKLVAHWKLSGERRYYFVTLKDEVTGENRTEKVLEGDSVNLKTLAKASHDDTENGRKVRKDYTFVGWQDSEGNVYSGNMTMPSADITLTADWNIRVRKYLTITFNTVLPQSSKAPITALEGDIITLDKMPNHSYEEDGTYFESFEYWKTEAGEEVSSVTLVSDITLIAKWSDEPVDTYKQRLLSVYSVDASGTSKLAWSGLQKVGARYPIEFVSALNIKDTTRLYKSYSDSTKKYADLFEKDADGRYIMPDQNLSLYMCNQFTITFTAKENKFDFTLTATLYQGDDINLNDILNYAGSNQDLLAVKTAITSNAKVYDTKNVDYYDYKFLGWNYDGSAFMAQVMLGKDFTLEANFDEGYKAYFKVYFDLVWYAPDGFSGDGSGGTGPTEVTPGNTLYVLQGESFDPSLYNSQRTRRFSWPSPNGTFKFNCTWSTTPPYTTSWFGAKSYDKNSVTPATKIDSMQGDLTLYPVWHRI